MAVYFMLPLDMEPFGMELFGMLLLGIELFGMELLGMELLGMELLGMELFGMAPGAAGGIDPDIVASPGTVMVVSRKTPPPPTLPCTRAFCGLFINVMQSWRWPSGRLMQRLVASCLYPLELSAVSWPRCAA